MFGHEDLPDSWQKSGKGRFAGEAVFIKAGAAGVASVSVEVDGWYVRHVDKGRQYNEEQNARLVGDVAKTQGMMTTMSSRR